MFERYFRQNKITHYLDFPDNTELIVIIPVLEDPDIFETIESLCRCSLPEAPVGVVIIINNAVGYDSRANRQLARKIEDVVDKERTDRQSGKPGIWFQLLEEYELPEKHAGVGLARKIAMDAAVAHFYRVGCPNGVVASLDADTTVEKNYLTEIVRFFASASIAGVSIAYAHRLNELPEGSPERDAIIRYELYLRYYCQALKFTGHPHAYQCIGSAFAVRAADYAAQGGMNKRQAGEDFYFLQKLIATGRYANLVTTKVYPSPRFSTRTPFGTGQAVQQIVAVGGYWPTYNFEAFLILKSFFATIDRLYKVDDDTLIDYFNDLPACLKDFLSETGFRDMMNEINGNCASVRQFHKRFYDYFNAFRVLKYLNFVHLNYFSRQDILFVVHSLMDVMSMPVSENMTDILVNFRSFD